MSETPFLQAGAVLGVPARAHAGWQAQSGRKVRKGDAASLGPGADRGSRCFAGRTKPLVELRAPTEPCDHRPTRHPPIRRNVLRVSGRRDARGDAVRGSSPDRIVRHHGTRRPRTPCKRLFSKRCQTHPKQRQPPAPGAFTLATPLRTAGRHAFLPNEAKLIRNSRNCLPQRQLRRLPRAELPADVPLCRVALFLLRQPEDREVILRPTGQTAGVA